MSIAQSDVVHAYRLILGREPENEQVVREHATGHATLAELRRAFLLSPELAGQLAARPAALPSLPLDVPPLRVETRTDPASLERIIGETARFWDRIGTEAPHWSVLTSAEYMPDRIRENEAKFHASGRGDLDLLLAILRRMGRSPAGFGSVLEYGCGVGRLTAHLAGSFARVQGLDISPPHLALAQDHLRRAGLGNVAFHQVTTGDLHPGGEFDLWFSRIVLQHNPPPVIHRILDLMFRRLEPGGVAVFQVPTYQVGYSFEVASYLRGETGRALEMHVLPQHEVLELGWRHRCRLVEMREDTRVVSDGPDWLSNTFVFCKD